jgi:glycerol-3-phosphate dehydrogenase
VLLVEKGDLASATSSASTGIVHGGVRYVPQMHFRLVRESLKERRELLKIAPHVVHPMTFAFVHQPGQAPYLGIRFVLKLYDWLAGRLPGNLHGSYGLNLAKHPFGDPLEGHLRRAVAYSDCQTMDARLVVLTAAAAALKGAAILTRTECVGLSQAGERWEVVLRNANGTRGVTARAVVNATGPWVRSFIDETRVGGDDAPGLRLIKGSHIIVPRQYEGEHAYVIGQPDGRIVFAIPYEDDFTLIGTTDVEYAGDAGDFGQVRISDAEVDYLCDAFNRVARSKITRVQVRGHYAGLRAQFDDGRSASEVSREFKLHLHSGTDAPLLSVYGGEADNASGAGP